MVKNIIKITFVILAGLIVFCEDNPVSRDSITQTGTIKGCILNSDSAGYFGAEVRIFGTSYNAYADSGGYYTFYNVPEGIYSVSIFVNTTRKDLDSVIVAVGDTTELEACIFHSSYNLVCSTAPTEDTAHYIGSLDLFDGDKEKKYSTGPYLSSSVIVDPYDYYYSSYAYTSAYCITGDTAYITFDVRQRYYSYERAVYSPWHDSVSIYNNGLLSQNIFMDKGKVSMLPLVISDNDTFEIRIQDDLLAEFIIYDTATILFNYVSITTGHETLYQYSDLSQVYSDYMVLDSIYYQIARTSYYETIDWDLKLVNDSTGDSCCWSNLNPDWGQEGKTDDNPMYSDNNSSSSYAYLQEGYDYDRIYAYDLPDGTYSIYVQYYRGPADSVTAMPKINIKFKNIYTSSHVIQYYTNFPVSGIGVKDIWYAGKISFPQKTFTPASP